MLRDNDKRVKATVARVLSKTAENYPEVFLQN
jgi:hypothetical protein